MDPWIISTIAACGLALIGAIKWLANEQKKSQAALAVAYEARIQALEALAATNKADLASLNTYIRTELADLAKESHAREIELVHIIRDQRQRHRSGEHTPVPEPTDMTDDGTQVILAQRKQRRERG